MQVSQDREIQALTGEKQRIEKELENMESISDDQEKLHEEALQFIQCDDMNKYRKKIKGFVAPFSSAVQSKDSKSSKTDKSKRYKFKSKEDKEAIKAKVAKIKKDRENAKNQEKIDKEKNYQKQRKMMKNLHSKLMREKMGNGDNDMYVDANQPRHSNPLYNVSQSQPALKGMPAQQQKHVRAPLQKVSNKLPNKLTMGGLTALNYEDFAGNDPDGFNPADIVGTESGSEDSILEQYRQNEANAIQEAYQFNENRNTERAVPIDKVNQRKGRNKSHVHTNPALHNSIADSSLLKKIPQKRMPGNLHTIAHKSKVLAFDILENQKLKHSTSRNR